MPNTDGISRLPKRIQHQHILASSNSIANGDCIRLWQSEFAAIGINMSITVMPDATWNSICLGAGRTYPALCARALGCTGLTSDPFTQPFQVYDG